MNVFVIIPVYNRLTHTQNLLACLRDQVGVKMQLVIVDDGSNDGTKEFLAAQKDIITITGTGNLWWAGAVDLALRVIHPLLKKNDFFVLMNNDTKVDNNFLRELTEASNNHHRAAVGSIVRDVKNFNQLIDIGPKSNLWNMAIWDIASELSLKEKQNLKKIYKVDFLPGRGTIYPGEVLDHVGYLRPHLLPHYHADYEFSNRVSKSGFDILVATSAVTYSMELFGNQRKSVSLLGRMFGKGSPDNILHKIIFFCLVGSPSQRISAIPRMIFSQIKQFLHPIKNLLRKVIRKIIDISRKDGERFLLLICALWVTKARASILAAFERRSKCRIVALNVYAAAQLIELHNNSTVMLVGSSRDDYIPYFKKLINEECLRYKIFENNFSKIDLLFCVISDYGYRDNVFMVSTLVEKLRVGGILYLVDDREAELCDPSLNILNEFSKFENFEIIAETISEWPIINGVFSDIFLNYCINKNIDNVNHQPPSFIAARRLI